MNSLTEWIWKDICCWLIYICVQAQYLISHKVNSMNLKIFLTQKINVSSPPILSDEIFKECKEGQ